MFDPREVREAVRVIVGNMFSNPQEPGLFDTPDRVTRFLREFATSVDPIEILGTSFQTTNDTMVVQTNIPLRGLCEHHLLPFIGTAHIGYIPTGLVVGLSKLTRLVRAVGSERPTIQEQMTCRIAGALAEHKVLRPAGVIVVVRAEHTCMTVRGVSAPGVMTITSAVRGVFETDLSARQEFLSLTSRV